jgi:hypothetical protein
MAQQVVTQKSSGYSNLAEENIVFPEAVLVAKRGKRQNAVRGILSTNEP